MARKNKETSYSKEKKRSTSVKATKPTQEIKSNRNRQAANSFWARFIQRSSGFSVQIVEYPKRLYRGLDLFFFLFFFWLWGVRFSDFVYIIHKTDLFIWEWPSIKEELVKIGGPIAFFTHFLTQFLYYPLLGGLLFAVGFFILQQLTARFFRLAGPLYAYSFLTPVLMSVAFLSTTFLIFDLLSPTELFVWLPGLISSLLTAMAYERFAGEKHRRLFALFLGLVSYLLTGGFSILGLLLAITGEYVRTRRAESKDETQSQLESAKTIESPTECPVDLDEVNSSSSSLQSDSSSVALSDATTRTETESDTDSKKAENADLLFQESQRSNSEILFLIALAIPYVFHFLCFSQLSFYMFYGTQLVVAPSVTKNFSKAFYVFDLWLLLLLGTLVVLSLIKVYRFRKITNGEVVRRSFSWNKKEARPVFLAVLIIFGGFLLAPLNPEFYALTSAQKLLERDDWDGLIAAEARCKKHPRQAIMLRFLALYEKGQLAERLFHRTQYCDSYSPFVEMSTIRIYGDKFLYRMGLPDPAAKMAMNRLVTRCRSGLALDTLARSAILMKEYTLAKKYLRAFEKTLFYRSWSRPYLNYIRQEEIKATNIARQKSGQPELKLELDETDWAEVAQVAREVELLRSRMPQNDALLNGMYPEMLMYDFIRTRTDFDVCAPQEQELILMTYLLIRSSELFVRHIDTWLAGRKGQPIPRHFQEALLIFSYIRKDVDRNKYRFDSDLLVQFSEFMKNQAVNKLQSDKTEYNRIRKNYEKTYWFYYFEVSDMPFY